MEKEHKIALVRILASGLLLVLSYVTSFTQIVTVALCVAAYIIIGGDIVVKAVRNIFRGEVFDECFLMSVATIGAFAIGEYPEAVAVMLFYQIGELFMDVAVDRSRDSISRLMDIRPDHANVEDADGTLRRVAPEEVPAGTVIVVKPGEKIPLDGTVVSGNSSLDTSALTGESMPREAGDGDSVISGSMNLTGVLRIKTTGTYGESTVAHILSLVENAENGKAHTEKFITRFARYYTPVVVAAAVLLAVVPPLFADGGWMLWLNRALIFLVISCPCALVVSVPLTFFAGIGGASRRGILFKGSNYIEALARVRTVVFDKTGTLTNGSFTVTGVYPVEGVEEETLVETAALAEIYSDHPVAAALRGACRQKTDKSRVGGAENFAGEGIMTYVDGKPVYAGNDRLMERAGVSFVAPAVVGTVVHVASEGKYLGHVVVSDTVKPQTAEALSALRRAGVEQTVMLTGDRSDVAESVAHELGIDEVHAGLLPDGKVQLMEDIIRRRRGQGTVAFVGDGINDAPVLKLSDVGIAMGAAGSDAAIEAADVVLMDDNPAKVAQGMSIARRTLSIVKQNIVFAIGVKVAVLLLGAVGLATMWAAVFSDVGVTVIAVLNAIRAGRRLQ
ncbi:cadmium-translocating P-type ATPase [Prevotella sp. PCHR]|uniref:P-type Zn(2+) transporter n=1 Tax=Xylanibacter caecicola TaxID=2736294 RepID=A0ABX2B1V3_9BACT|nr:heavy metal translocating P-type ATPase [Xylanibacter caecicola]NPE25484.1 cadmium-translocating P-type ATPase [Xylanibacter caecicola]